MKGSEMEDKIDKRGIIKRLRYAIKQIDDSQETKQLIEKDLKLFEKEMGLFYTGKKAGIKEATTDLKKEILGIIDSPEFLKRLSAIEHNQWMDWSFDLARKENLSNERITRWKKCWIPYPKLPEEIKEEDRKWARRVLIEIKKSDFRGGQMNTRGIDTMAKLTFFLFVFFFFLDVFVSMTVYKYSRPYFMQYEVARDFATFLKYGFFPWMFFWGNAVPLAVLGGGWVLARRNGSLLVIYGAMLPAIGMAFLHAFGAVSWLI